MTAGNNNVPRAEARERCRLARETGCHGIIAYRNRRYFVRDTSAQSVDEVWEILNRMPYSVRDFVRDFSGSHGYPTTLTAAQDAASGRRDGAFGMRADPGLLTRKETRALRSYKRRLKRRGVADT